MEVEAAKFIGAGLATMSLLGAGIGLGILFGKFLEGGLRNPSAVPAMTTNFFIAFAITEATGLFGLVMGFLMLFS